ncbi:37S ribosomal protein S5 [Diaporthe sp. PMI_573]|nr:37S ribosomal protein S5 [Diaporthaceae sp. PMI_573]
MSVATPAARRLLCRSLAANSAKTSARAAAAAAAPGSLCQRHNFHASAPMAGRKRSPFKNVKADELDLSNPETRRRFKEESLPDWDETDLKSLKKKYTPEQLSAVQLGEKVIDTDDLAVQGRIRNDPYAFEYLEDFSKVRPVVDKRVKNYRPVDTTAKFMTPDEFGDDFVEFVRQLNEKREDLAKGIDSEGPEEISDLEAYKYLMERNSMTGFDGGDTHLAPDLPDKVPGVAGLYKRQMDESDGGLDPEGTYQELKKKTGMSVREILDIFNKQTKILVRRYVSNQTRLGKIRSTYILAMAGNGNGRLGIGEAKSVDSEVSVMKAKLSAIQNMVPIRRYENRTIYGNVEAKVGGTIVQMYTRPPGFGLRVSHRMFEIARLAGISDLSVRMPRSRNPMNSVKACFQALTNQPDPELIALGRGKKLVDARKVYYGGAVH